jgi:hypothetical protein
MVENEKDQEEHTAFCRMPSDIPTVHSHPDPFIVAGSCDGDWRRHPLFLPPAF